MLIVLLLLFNCNAEAGFESWKAGIDEVVDQVESEYGNRAQIVADKYESVERDDLIAIITVESNGNEQAVSSTSVKGLTMITLEVVDLIEEKEGITIDRLHPFESIFAAGWYLNYLMENYNFSIKEAHGAYFYGPSGLRNELNDQRVEDLYHVKKIIHTKRIISENH